MHDVRLILYNKTYNVKSSLTTLLLSYLLVSSRILNLPEDSLQVFQNGLQPREGLPQPLGPPQQDKGPRPLVVPQSGFGLITDTVKFHLKCNTAITFYLNFAKNDMFC